MSEDTCQTCGARCCKTAVMTMDTAEFRRVRALPGGNAFKAFAVSPNVWQVEMRFMRGCPFLVEDRCTIYEQRPIACRRYPERPERGCRLWPLAS